MSANNNSKKLTANEKATQIAAARTAAIIGITVNATIIYVLRDVKSENCQCTDDWRYTFCYYYSMVLIVINTIYLVTGNKNILEKYMSFLNVMNFINVICLVTYLHKLSTSKCNCEYTPVQKLIRYSYTVVTFFYFVTIIYTVFFLLALK